MRQLFYEGPERLVWRDVPKPKIKADHEVLVSTIAATICDVDAAIIRGMSPFEPPFALGHESVARVEDKGDAVSNLEIGDVVSVPYHRTCGHCHSCSNQVPLHCENRDVPAIPSYGFPSAGEWGGMFSETYRVPWASHALVKVPSNVDPIAAVSMGDNLTDAWSTTATHLKSKPGATVLITSIGGYGLYATQWASAYGASRITYVDHDTTRLKLAAKLGARSVLWEAGLKDKFKYDVLINARPGVEPLTFCLRSAAPGAFCTNMVIFFDDVTLPLDAMHYSGVTFQSTYSPTRNFMPEVARALSEKVINPREIESEIISLDDAPQRLASPTHKPIVVFD
jgi:alcohol dehydrogenase